MKTAYEDFHGEAAVRLTGGQLTALIVPSFGANCIELTEPDSGASFLRTPADADVLRAGPNVYGLPLLFPPNRIEDGHFEFDGRPYDLAINEPARGCHIHGTLSSTPFEHLGGGRFRYRADAEHPYPGYPHAFTVERSYELDGCCLTQTVTVVNESELRMPVGVGCHAAWRIPFLPGECGSAYTLQIPARRRWLCSERFLPTGAYETDTPFLQALRAGKLTPETQAVSCTFDCDPGIISLQGETHRFEMEMEAPYRFMTIWNAGGGQGFICPEPQSWIVNAPNLPLPASETGFDQLQPGESRRYVFRCTVVHS